MAFATVGPKVLKKFWVGIYSKPKIFSKLLGLLRVASSASVNFNKYIRAFQPYLKKTEINPFTIMIKVIKGKIHLQ